MEKPQGHTALFWFRRDLRLDDNHALFEALKCGLPVVPLFIFDKTILDKLEDKQDRRVAFIHEQLQMLKKQLKSFGSDLLVYYGFPMEILKEVIKTFKVKSVYFNHDYEVYARERDAAVNSICQSMGVGVYGFKDQVIFEKNEVVKEDAKPYTVFTPYSKKWKSQLLKDGIKSYPSDEMTGYYLNFEPCELPTLESMCFQRVEHMVKPLEIDTLRIVSYHNTRDIPSVEGTSRLSVHLRFGTLSIRKLVKHAQELNQVYLNELIWREFYMMILWHFPHVEKKAFKPVYDFIPWRNSEKEFDAWCRGETAYPIVDAAMRELNHTGFMHNRARMIVAGFLTKHLLIDWRWGEAWFAQKLTDYELSSNNGGWQWAAGTGCDAAPYFRVFNPYTQAAKFDPDGFYVSRWLDKSDLLRPPIVEHKMARERAIKVYKETLQKYR